MKLDYLSTAVTVCCILHNICEVHHDEYDEQWLDVVNANSNEQEGMSCEEVRAVCAYHTQGYYTMSLHLASA